MITIPELPELEFNEDKHIYKLNGFVLPSVSRIMKPLSSEYYGDIDKEVLNKAAKKGTDVHAAVENYLLFGIEDITPVLQNYFKGFKSWIDINKPVPVKTECAVYHRTLNYAGKPDLICELNGVPTLVDFKTTRSIAHMLTRIQLEAYRQAFVSHGVEVKRKIIIQVGLDGTYHQEEYPCNDVESWKVFTELLDVYRYIKKYKK